MAVLTLFGQPTSPATLTSDPSAYTLGVQFKVSSSGCTLTGIYFFSAPGAGNLPQNIALYQSTGVGTGTQIAFQVATWSGAAASGWVRAAFSSPPSLTSGVNYKACVFDDASGGSWYSGTPSYWSSGAGSGGVTNGTLSAPNNAGSVDGQDCFNIGALAYPVSTFNAANYWVDPEVTTAGGTAHTATASLTVTPSFTAARVRGRFRTAALAVTPSLSAARTRGRNRTASLAVVPAFRAVPSGGEQPAIQQGSWWGLDSVFKQSRQEFEAFVSRPPMACPNDGEPLMNAPATKAGSGVQLYCRYCHFQYPRDWTTPQRPMPW